MTTYQLRVSDARDRTLAVETSDSIAYIVEATRTALTRARKHHRVRALITYGGPADYWFCLTDYAVPPTRARLDANIDDTVRELSAHLHWTADHPDRSAAATAAVRPGE